MERITHAVCRVVRLLRTLALAALLLAPALVLARPPDDNSLTRLGRLRGVITVTNKGSNTCIDNECNIENISMAQGSSIIVVAMSYDTGVSTGLTASWNGQALTEDRQGQWVPSVPIVLGFSVFSKHNLSAGTGTVVVDGSVTVLSMVVTAAQVTGLAASATDKVANASGAGDEADSGPTATTSQANELIFGAVGTLNTETPEIGGGLWNGGFTDFQSADDIGFGDYGIAISTGYLIVSSASTYQSFKSSMNNTGGGMKWSSIVVTYKKAP